MTAPTGVYRFTSIARPVDPAYPTNRALLILMPIAAAAAALLHLAGLGHGESATSTAIAAALASFGAWALTRELAPDDNPAAFVSLVLGFGAQLLWGPSTVIPLFVALVLVRVVNRSTGLQPRVADAVLVTGFMVWATGRLGDPLVGLAAAIAFFLDASLSRPARWQLVTGFVCLAVSMVFVMRDGVAMPALAELEDAPFWLAIAVLAAYAVVTFTTRRIVSVGDVSGERLDAARVRGGMFVAGLLAAGAPVLPGERGMNTLIWACLLGVAASRALAGLDARRPPAASN
jgi:hypothetical protein